MAAQWGDHTLAPGTYAVWYFARQLQPGFLPVINVQVFTSTSDVGEKRISQVMGILGSTRWVQVLCGCK